VPEHASVLVYFIFRGMYPGDGPIKPLHLVAW
jgi:hypothetical protein